VIIPSSANAMRFVQEKIAIAQSRFRILINRDHDRLDVMEAVTLTGCHMANIGQRFGSTADYPHCGRTTLTDHETSISPLRSGS
jgi:hypothetical protein